MKKEYQQPRTNVIEIETSEMIAASEARSNKREFTNHDNGETGFSRGWNGLWEE